MVFYGPDGGIADCNEAFRSLLRLSEGCHLSEASPQDQARRLGWQAHPWDEIGRLCGAQRSYGPFEKVLTDAHGRSVTVESHAYLLTDGDQKTTGAWEVLHDVTQRKQADAELILSAEAFARYSDGVILTDAAGVILTVNDAFTRTTGYTRDMLRGQRPNLFKSGRHDPAFYSNMREQIDHRAHRAREARRHFLPQTGENRAGLAENLADIRVQFARDDLHQRGLARTVTAEETDALAPVNLEIDLIEQRRATEAQADIE